MSVIGRASRFLLSNAAVTYATWNPSDKAAAITLSGGNLVVSFSSSTIASCRATIGKSSGKWYWEVTIGATYSDLIMGVANATMSLTQFVGGDTNSVGYYSGGNIYYNGSNVVSAATYATGDVIGIAMDCAGNTSWYKNNTLQGAYATPSVPQYPAIGSAGSGNFSATANFGASAFVYSPPSGFNAGVY